MIDFVCKFAIAWGCYKLADGIIEDTLPERLHVVAWIVITVLLWAFLP